MEQGSDMPPEGGPLKCFYWLNPPDWCNLGWGRHKLWGDGGNIKFNVYRRWGRMSVKWSPTNGSATSPEGRLFDTMVMSGITFNIITNNIDGTI